MPDPFFVESDFGGEYILLRQMRCIKETIARVCGACSSELVVRETKNNNTEVYMTRECLFETGHRLGLDDACGNHDTYSGIQTADVLYELHDRLAAVHYRVDQHYGVLALDMAQYDVARTVGMNEQGVRKGIADTEGHRFSAVY
jgi:hypothetical protein